MAKRQVQEILRLKALIGSKPRRVTPPAAPPTPPAVTSPTKASEPRAAATPAAAGFTPAVGALHLGQSTGLTPRAVELSPDHVALVEALRRMPVELREVITLHHVADLPVAEVARTLGVPDGTVKTRLARGRAQLAELLSDREESNRG